MSNVKRNILTTLNYGDSGFPIYFNDSLRIKFIQVLNNKSLNL